MPGKINKISKTVFMVLLLMMFWIPGQAQAQSNIPTISCGIVVVMPYHYSIDCSSIKRSDKAEVKTSQTSLSEQKTLPRSVSASGPNFRLGRLGRGRLLEGLRELIQKIARAFEMSPRIIEAVALVESGGSQAARSPKGAIGVMQLMPGTAQGLGVNPYNLEENIRGGAMYLKTQIDRFGSLPLALAAYNAGPGAVEKYGGIPPYKETQNYVARVMSMLEGEA